MISNKIFLKTYYNKSAFAFESEILNKNNIEFEINDRSKQINFRVPQSGFFEVDIFVNESDFDKAYNLLLQINHI